MAVAILWGYSSRRVPPPDQPLSEGCCQRWGDPGSVPSKLAKVYPCCWQMDYDQEYNMPIGMTPQRRTEEERDPTKVCAALQWYHFMLR